MTSDRDRQIEQICSAALDCEPDLRAAFVRDACATDEALRLEVESLLERERRAEAFLVTPALDLAARGIADHAGPPLVGRQVGTYRLLSLLGAGGMGEVYRARDTTLKRDVAIKVLPMIFTHDPHRQGRFEHEALVLASLNHPNIGTIYGIAEADGVRGLVLELVEGPTLADRLVHGPLPVVEAVLIARQIAEALEAAHEKGIVHRDLKPSNIKITGDGVVKVLDFGIAKAIAGDGSADHLPASPTTGTHDGAIVGTAAYMSPEQARGKVIDRRADVWAFGCVLYEMLTGRAAFAGDTRSDPIAVRGEREPAWGDLPESLPAGIRRVLHRCLNKDLRNRLHDIADARLELDEIASATPADAITRRGGERWPRVAAALLLLVAAGLTIAQLRSSPRPALFVTRFSIPPPENGSFARGSNGRMLAISPDGRTLAFAGRRRGGGNMLWLRALDALTPRSVPGSEGAEGLFWSPDGGSVGFFAGGKLKAVSIERGELRTVCEVTGSTTQATWSQAGVILFAAETRGVGGLLRVSSAGGVASSETTPERSRGETGHLAPYFLPDGQHYLYDVTAADGGSIYVGTLGSKDRIRLLSPSETHGASSVLGTALAYAAPGYVLFVRDRTLMAQPFDAARLERLGEPVPVIEGVRNIGTGSAAFSVSPTGVLAYWSGGELATQRLAWSTRDGRQTALAVPERAYGRLSLAPDGTRAAVEAQGHDEVQSISLIDLVRSTSTTVTSDAFSIWPLWSPDGASVIFSSSRGGMLAPYRQPVAAGEEAQRLFDSRGATVATDWSSDGRTIVYTMSGPSGAEIGVFALEDTAAPHPVLHLPTAVPDGRLSPNGRWMAYVATESGASQVYVTSFPHGRGRWPISTSGGRQPRWRRDGTELYYLSHDQRLMAVTVGSGPAFVSGVPRSLFETPATQYAVAGDGRFLLELPAVPETSPPITLVVNWTPALKR
jgi:eukaryotic-like serine/threonine-protein kinase